MNDREWNVRAARLFCFCVYGVLAYASLKYFLPACLPIVVAVLIGAVVFCTSEKISSVTHLPHALCATIILCIIVGLFGTLSVYLCRYLLAQIKQLIFILSHGGADLVAARAREMPVFKLVYSFMAQNDIGGEGAFANALTSVLSHLSNFIGGFLGKALKATPSALLSGLVSLIACFYISVDMRRICSAILGFLPCGAARAVLRIKSQVLPILRKFAGAYVKIYALTFAEVFLGLCVLCPRFALLGALGVATVDILPVLGAGIVLVPWGIAELLMENYFLGVGLLLLYVVISIVRQIVEPRLLGSAAGISPFVALLAMFAGYKLLGVLGMLVLPIALSVYKKVSAERITE